MFEIAHLIDRYNRNTVEICFRKEIFAWSSSYNWDCLCHCCCHILPQMMLFSSQTLYEGCALGLLTEQESAPKTISRRHTPSPPNATAEVMVINQL